ncbi:MAG: hypothetical protein HY053_07210 [Proteobacteria bacterium]|nr:hypothetical protein [Pseudomonadota bacterium]
MAPRNFAELEKRAFQFVAERGYGDERTEAALDTWQMHRALAGQMISESFSGSDDF